jgi:glycosyltransferase involved in cell wall biosynthesis
MEALRLCVVIPTYNNRKTLAGVLNDVLQYTSSVIVVNDGSTDDTAGILGGFAGEIEIVSYTPNRGKGYALKCGFDKAEALGYLGAVTIDSDGQHFASEIEKFVGYAEKNPGTFLLGQRTTEGEMPSKNSFANKFSNFWFTVQTAYRLNDTQNGFRLYPLAVMKGLRPISSRYEAELEMLVRSAWRGIRIVPVPTRVYYPPEGERVTHFRPGKDFFRISVLNTLFTLSAIVYGYPSMLFHRLLTPKKKP